MTAKEFAEKNAGKQFTVRVAARNMPVTVIGHSTSGRDLCVRIDDGTPNWEYGTSAPDIVLVVPASTVDRKAQCMWSNTAALTNVPATPARTGNRVLVVKSQYRDAHALVAAHAGHLVEVADGIAVGTQGYIIGADDEMDVIVGLKARAIDTDGYPVGWWLNDEYGNRPEVIAPGNPVIQKHNLTYGIWVTWTNLYLVEQRGLETATVTAPRKRAPVKFPHTCACGGSAFVMARTVECSNSRCRFYAPNARGAL